jgi:hypothetical protein
MEVREMPKACENFTVRQIVRVYLSICRVQ